jgi:capsule polysaccharide modification protein KpsS
VGRPSSLALEALRTLGRVWSFYDAMDDFPEFYRGLARQAVATCAAFGDGRASQRIVAALQERTVMRAQS